ncbi:hypothetical protein BGX38DRAFT_1176552, partial [Terfezia claveryi]
PIKTPIGACATTVESLDIVVDSVIEGKARICIVGDFHDFQGMVHMSLPICKP